MQVYVKDLDRCIELEESITVITLENPVMFRDIYFSSDQKLIISTGLKELLPAQILLIPNCYDLDLNSRKNITILHKKFLNLMSENNQIDLSIIESKSIEIMESLIMSQELDVDYDYQIDPLALFKLLNVRFTTCSVENYVEYATNYFKTIADFLGIKVFITFNFSKNFNEQEFKIIMHELSLYEIKIIDFCLETSPKLTPNSLIVDEDYCII